MRSAAKRRREDARGVLRARIEEFLAQTREPVVLEPGERPIPLEAGKYSLKERGSSCVLEVWSEAGSLVRRLTAIGAESRGRLELKARRFGGGETTLQLLDRASKSFGLERRADQARFRTFLRRLLEREFTDWTLSGLTSAADLENSLSPVYPRGLHVRGREAWAVIGVAEASGRPACDQMLAFGLIWLDHLRAARKQRVVGGLKLFVPRGWARATANRLTCLRADASRFRLYEYDRRGSLAETDRRDWGNLSSELPYRPAAIEPAPPIAAMVEKIRGAYRVDSVTRGDGLLSLRLRGVEFAQVGKGVMTFGLERRVPLTEANFAELEALVGELSRFRSPDAPDLSNPLYRAHPEKWLEAEVRRRMRVLDPSLRPAPVYAQTPATRGLSRGVVDLLCCDRGGRLAVIELKASEDIQLPLQGLDYWLRVKLHLERGEFATRGYFPGIALSQEPPRLLLVAPALEFHPTTETMLKYFSPAVPVERIGVGADWRRELRAAFRLSGASRPG